MTQPLRTLRDDDSAVSPVIGVILMVAITVILAAVIGAFVLGLGDGLQRAPQPALNAEDASVAYVNDTDDGYSVNASAAAFVITHDGGDAIAFGDVRIVLEGDGIDTTRFEEGSWTDNDLMLHYDGDSSPDADDVFEVGDSAVIGNADDSETGLVPGNDYRIRLIHVPSDSILLDTELTLR